MDLKEYIDSGVIELYVMGALSSQEKEEFERLLSVHPELKIEMDAVEAALYQNAIENAVEPPSYLKAQILKQITSEPFNIENKFNTSKKTINMWSTTGIAASIVIALLSVTSSVYFYFKWKAAEHQIAIYETEKNQVADLLLQVNQTFTETKEKLDFLRDIDTKTIALNSTKPGMNYSAIVYWNEKSHLSYIDIRQLPAPGKDQQYQLWALVDGKPVDAGVFSFGDSTDVSRVKDIERADAWAVTLEPAGGSISPHLDQLYLISKS